MFLREVVARVRDAGGKPFLTDCNTLYRGKRFNAVDHLACAIHNGFSFATVDAPLIIADGLDGRDGATSPIEGGKHFDSVRIGAAAAHADAMVAVTHVKGHEATGFGGALKNVGMGLGVRSAKQRMHSDFSPRSSAEKCTACGRCVAVVPRERDRGRARPRRRGRLRALLRLRRVRRQLPFRARSRSSGRRRPRRFRRRSSSTLRAPWPARRARRSTSRSSRTYRPTATAGTSRMRRSCPTSACSPPPTSSRSTRPPTIW